MSRTNNLDHSHRVVGYAKTLAAAPIWTYFGFFLVFIGDFVLFFLHVSHSWVDYVWWESPLASASRSFLAHYVRLQQLDIADLACFAVYSPTTNNNGGQKVRVITTLRR